MEDTHFIGLVSIQEQQKKKQLENLLIDLIQILGDLNFNQQWYTEK